MKHSSHQFGNQFSGFGCQSEKFALAPVLSAISCPALSAQVEKVISRP